MTYKTAYRTIITPYRRVAMAGGTKMEIGGLTFRICTRCQHWVKRKLVACSCPCHRNTPRGETSE